MADCLCKVFNGTSERMKTKTKVPSYLNWNGIYEENGMAMHAGEDMGKEKFLFTTGRSEDWCTHCGNQYVGFLKTENIGAREMVQRLKAPDTLTENAGLIPSIHMAAVAPVPVYLMPVSGLGGHPACMWDTYMHIGKYSYT